MQLAESLTQAINTLNNNKTIAARTTPSSLHDHSCGMSHDLPIAKEHRHKPNEVYAVAWAGDGEE